MYCCDFCDYQDGKNKSIYNNIKVSMQATHEFIK